VEAKAAPEGSITVPDTSSKTETPTPATIRRARIRDIATPFGWTRRHLESTAGYVTGHGDNPRMTRGTSRSSF
jgi:hypothetical protein